MGTIEENKICYSYYDWPENGDEWSLFWGGSEYLWWGTIFPRVHPFLPNRRVLELAPGFGRCTQFLIDLSERLIVVDLVEKCVEACRQRFGRHDHFEAHVNDGCTLPMIESDSIEFIFSWDSLVHTQRDVMESYTREFARILKPNGKGFIHHSNMGSFRDEQTGTFKPGVENKHWRGEDASADGFVECCGRVGLVCVSQELIAWGGTILNDVFSIFTKTDEKPAGPPFRIENYEFMREADKSLKLAKLHNPDNSFDKLKSIIGRDPFETSSPGLEYTVDPSTASSDAK